MMLEGRIKHSHATFLLLLMIGARNHRSSAGINFIETNRQSRGGALDQSRRQHGTVRTKFLIVHHHTVAQPPLPTGDLCESKFVEFYGDV